MRRADKMMTRERAMQALTGTFSGRLATIGADGYPYCLPLLFIEQGCITFTAKSDEFLRGQQFLEAFHFGR